MAHIRTYARIKPTSTPYDGLDTTDSQVYLRMEKGSTLNKSCHVAPPATHTYQFNHVFNSKVTQQEVFNGVATEIIHGMLAFNNLSFQLNEASYMVGGIHRKISL